VEVLFERFPGLRMRRLVGNVRVLLVPEIKKEQLLALSTKEKTCLGSSVPDPDVLGLSDPDP
jgi:hypothetical protein